MKARASLLLGVMVSMAGLAAATAQPYSIGWYKVSGGGGTSTGGQYSVSGTIGQPDAGGPLTNGTYSLTGGFWVVTAVQTPGAPLLTIKASGSNRILISWPSPSTGFQLQQAASLVSPGWTSFPGTTNDDGTNKSVTIQPPTGNEFFRLVK